MKRKKFIEDITTLLPDLFVFTVMVTAVLFSFFTFLELNPSVFWIFILVVITVIISYFIFSNLVSTLAFLGFLIFFALCMTLDYYLGIFSYFIGIFRYSWNFLDWLIKAIISNNYRAFALLGTEFIIFASAGITLLYYLFVIKWKFFLTYTVFTISLFIYWSIAEYNYHSRQLIIRVFFVVLFAFMYFFAANRYRFISINNEFTQNRMTYLKWQKYVVPVIAVILILSLIIMPADINKDLQNDNVFKLLEQVRLNVVSWFNMANAGLPGKFNMSYVGFSHDQSELGGPVRLSTNHVFDIKAKKQIYLRGAVFDIYTGRGWKSALQEKGYMFDSSSEAKFREFFYMDDVFYFRNMNLYQLYSADVDKIDISTTSVFFANNPVVMRLEENNLFFNERSEIYSNKNLRGNKYSFEYYDINLTQSMIDFLRNNSFEFKEPNSNNYSNTDMLNKMKKIKSLYLQLPENVPERVYQLAMSITSSANYQIDKVLLIKNYLQSNYDYTLSPGMVPEGVDFVDHFLFDTREGYCTYYATAMTILCRSIGIPARYVTGFRVDNPVPEGYTQVFNYNAHAWTEVYFPNVGWLTFDPVSHSDFISNEIRARTGSTVPMPEDSNPPETPTPTPQESPTPETSLETQETTEPTPPQESIGLYSIPPGPKPINVNGFIFVLLILGIVAAACFIYLFLRIKKKQVRVLTYKEKIIDKLNNCITVLSQLNCPMETGETIARYFTKASNWLPKVEESVKPYMAAEIIDKLDAEEAGRLFEKAVYSDYVLTEEEMAYLDRFYNKISKYLYIVKTNIENRMKKKNK